MGAGVSATDRFDTTAYDRLRRAATTERQTLVVRLAGEVGLRPAEIVALEPRHLETRRRRGTAHHLLHVDDGDGGRLAYVPAAVEAVIRSYAESIGCAADERLVDVTPRRVQMLVSDAARRAAEDESMVASVSTRALRRFHARSLLEAGVDPRVVLATTAWSRLDTLTDGATPADAGTIVDAFAGTPATPDGDGAAGRSAPHGTPPASTDAVGRRCTDLVDGVVSLGGSLSTASTREAIERAACRALGDHYEYAWIVSERGNDRLQVKEAAAPAGATVPDVPPGALCREVQESGDPGVTAGSGLHDEAGTSTRVAVPIEHGDATYGVLEVGVATAPAEVSGRERRVLGDIGRRLGQAIAAVERRRLLLADSVVQLAFRCTDERATLVQLSRSLECSFTLTGLVPRENGALLAFVWLEGAPPDDVFDRAAGIAAIDSARLIRSGDDGALIEFVLTDESPALTLVEAGGSLTELTVDRGDARLTAEFVPDVDVREVVEYVESAFPDTKMVTKREVERSVQTDTEFRQALGDTLTDKQRAALRTAHLSGYFDWPRGSTAEELAESLGVSSPTFHSHLRRAQRKLLSTFFEDREA